MSQKNNSKNSGVKNREIKTTEVKNAEIREEEANLTDVKDTGEENKTAGKNVMKNKEKAPKKKLSAFQKRLVRYLIIVCITGIIGVIIASVKFFGSEKIRRNASAYIEFTYDGAAQNLTPTGEKFSIDAIYSDKVLDAAIEKAGLTGKYTADKVKGSMAVDGSYPGDVIGKIKEYNSLYNFSESRNVSINDYYPTIFTVTLFDEFDTSISESSLNKLVQAIVDEYKEYFLNKYIYAFDMEEFDALLEQNDYDYAQRVKILKRRLQILENYSGEMYELDTNFRQDGKSFNDIRIKCLEIENDSLNKAEASIMMDVLTISSEKLRNQYEYEKKLLENEKEYKEISLEEINKLIENYQMDGILYIPSGDSMIKIDGNSKETYEKLVDKKREISDRLVEIEAEIARFDIYLKDMQKTVYGSSSKNQKIVAELESINQKIFEQRDTFKSMIKAYNASKIPDDALYVSETEYRDAKLFSMSFVLAVLKSAGPLCIIVILICCLHAAFCEIRNYKKSLNETA